MSRMVPQISTAADMMAVRGSGSSAARLLNTGMDVGAIRPIQGPDGQTYITIGNGANETTGEPQYQSLVTNAPSILRPREWITVDQAILRVARDRLRLWGDIVGAGLTYNIPNGLNYTVLQHQTMTDAGTATLSMDGRRRGNNDRPLFDLANLPLPIVHCDFDMSLRELAVTRNSGAPLDTVMAEQAAHVVAEKVEQLTLGVLDTYSYGGGTIYGLTNFPSRLTYSMTLPTDGGWTPNTAITQLLTMRQNAQNVKRFGPWKIYNSPAWDAYLDRDYSATYPGVTLRSRIAAVNGLSSPVTLDYLTGYQMIMVEMNSRTIRAVTGMPMTTVQWETEGGMDLHFKVMAIMVPQLRADSDETTGIVHGTAA